MLTYRHALPEEREAYIAFANMVFSHDGGSIDFLKILPKVYAEEADGAKLQRIAFDSEKGIRGLVAALPNTLHLYDETLKTGYIGTVSTHPDARGEGHMKALMAMCLDEMRADGTDIVLLGGRRQRYEHFGYVRGGMSCTHLITEPNLQYALADVSTDGLAFTEIFPGDAMEEAAAKFHEARGVRFDRKPFAVVCRSYNYRLWGITENGTLIGFLVSNASETELEDICVSDTQMLGRVLKAWFYKLGDNFTVRIPAIEAAFHAHLCTWTERTTLSATANIRILNYARTVRAFLRTKARYETLQDGELCLNCEGQVFTVHVENNTVTVTEGGTPAYTLDVLAAGNLLTNPFPYEGRPAMPLNWFPLPVFSTESDAF